MIKGVKDVYYNVSDMDRAVKFYRDVLGMKLIVSSPYWSALEIGRVQIGLHWSGGERVPEIRFDEHGAHSGATLTLFSDDIVEDTQGLVTHGVEIVGQLDEEWGKLTVFKDPDGNILKLMQPVEEMNSNKEMGLAQG